MNFLMLFIPCVLTLGFIFDTYFNRDVMLTMEVNTPLCNSSQRIFPDNVIINSRRIRVAQVR